MQREKFFSDQWIASLMSKQTKIRNKMCPDWSNQLENKDKGPVCTVSHYLSIHDFFISHKRNALYTQQHKQISEIYFRINTFE